ncbi:MAG: hypothetical protein WA058_00070 [Minisyncoccia bacterium]
MKIDSNTITIIIITIVIAAGAYWYFFTGTGNQAPLTTTNVVENQAQTEFQALVSVLHPITFDTKIFTDPRFMGLVDLATPIIPEPSGRSDPFALISGISGK